MTKLVAPAPQRRRPCSRLRERGDAGQGDRRRAAAGPAARRRRARTRRKPDRRRVGVRPRHACAPIAALSPAGAPARGPAATRTRQIADLQQRQQPGAREIHVEADGFVDRHFQRRRAGPAAERQHDGEAREAEEEDQRRDRRRLALQDRPVEKRKIAPGRMPSCAASRQCSPGTAASDAEEDPRGERRVEEDVRDQDARQAVEPAAGIDADRPQRLARPSRRGRAPRRCRTPRRSPAARSRD